MLFDDRLATVLRQSAASESGQRTQFRQLLDLLGSRPQPLHPHEGVREQGLLAAAWLRMDALTDAIPAPDRASIIREQGWRFRSAELTGYFAEHEPEVASAALLRAELSAAQWAALIPDLPIRARGFLRLRRDLPIDAEEVLDRLGVYDRGLPAPSAPPYPMTREPDPRQETSNQPSGFDSASLAPGYLRAVPQEFTPDDTANLADPVPRLDREMNERSEISALVERIAQFRRDRSEALEDADLSPRLPLIELAEPAVREVTSFGFVADAAGRIEWATGDVAPKVIGMRLISASGAEQTKYPNMPALARIFACRQPIIRTPIRLQGAPAIAGDWLVDAEPRFTSEGHFAGYLGRFRRSQTDPLPTDAVSPEADRIRQLLHELRTPITAVQGYAEVIQQQLFGPAPHEYRALAAAIAADAARILAGFDELDRLARLETGALGIAPGESDLAGLVRQMTGQINAALAAKDAGIDLNADRDTSLIVTIDEEEAEALLWRLLATFAACCAPAERLSAQLVPVFDGPVAMAQLVSDVPARLLANDDPFGSEIRTSGQSISAGLFGSGFSLRLARAEAARAGGALVQDGSRMALRLPLLAGAQTISQSVASYKSV